MEPCNPLVYDFSIRKRRKLFKKEDIKESGLLIDGIDNLDDILRLVQQPHFSRLRKKVLLQMDSLLKHTLEKVKHDNRVHY